MSLTDRLRSPDTKAFFFKKYNLVITKHANNTLTPLFSVIIKITLKRNTDHDHFTAFFFIFFVVASFSCQKVNQVPHPMGSAHVFNQKLFKKKGI